MVDAGHLLATEDERPRAAGAHSGVPELRSDPAGRPVARDVVLSRDEVDGLMTGLLTSGGAPMGTTKLADSLNDNGDGLGR